MRRTWWIIGLLIGIGVVGAIVCRLSCCCGHQQEEEETPDIENGDQEEEPSEEGETA